MPYRVNPTNGSMDYIDLHHGLALLHESLDRVDALDAHGFLSDEMARQRQAEADYAVILYRQCAMEAAMSDEQLSRYQKSGQTLNDFWTATEATEAGVEADPVTVSAIPGSVGYFVVQGRGGPHQFASRTAAEAEAEKRRR